MTKTNIISHKDDVKTVLDYHWQQGKGIESVHFIIDTDKTFSLLIITEKETVHYKLPIGLQQEVYDNLWDTRAKLFDYRNGKWSTIN